MNRRDGAIALGLVALVWAVYLACMAHGDRAWDSLVTAGVVDHWSEVPLKYFFHFAHFLVIPFSLPFWLSGLWSDPLRAVSAAESFFTALTTATLYLSLRRFGQSRLLSVPGSLVYPLTFAAWFGSTAGEEKAMAAWAVATSMYLLMDSLEIFPQPARVPAWVAGLSLTGAVFVHLMNALLFPATALVLLLQRRGRRDWAQLLVVPGALVGLAYVFVGTVLYGVPLLEFRTWLTQYHEEARPGAQGMNLLDFVLGGWTKSFLGLEWIPVYPVFGPVWALLSLGGLVLLWRRQRPLAALLGTFVLLHTAHFVHYEPGHFESWVTFVYLTVLIVLLAARRLAVPLLLLQLVCMGPSLAHAHRDNLHEQVVAAARQAVPPGSLLLHNRPFLQYYFWLVPGPTEIFGNLYPITREKLLSFNFFRNPYSDLMCRTRHTVPELNERLGRGEVISFLCLDHPAVVAYFAQFMELEPATRFQAGPAPFAILRVRRFIENPTVTLPDVEK